MRWDKHGRSYLEMDGKLVCDHVVVVLIESVKAVLRGTPLREGIPDDFALRGLEQIFVPPSLSPSNFHVF